MINTLTRRQTHQQQPIYLYLIIYNNEKMKIPPIRMPQIFTKQSYKYETIKLYLRKWNYRVEFSFQSKDKRQEAIDEIRKFKGKHGVKCYYYWQKGQSSYYLMQQWEYRNAITYNLNDFQSAEMDEPDQERMRLGQGSQKSLKEADQQNNKREREEQIDKQEIMGKRENEKLKEEKGKQQKQNTDQIGQQDFKKAMNKNNQTENLICLPKKQEDKNKSESFDKLEFKRMSYMEQQQQGQEQKQKNMLILEGNLKKQDGNRNRMDVQKQQKECRIEERKDEQDEENTLKQGCKQKEELPFQQDMNKIMNKQMMQENEPLNINSNQNLTIFTEREQRIVTRRSAKGKNIQLSKKVNENKEKAEENQSLLFPDKNKTKNIGKNRNKKGISTAQNLEDKSEKKVDIKFVIQKKRGAKQTQNRKQVQEGPTNIQSKTNKISTEMDIEDNKPKQKQIDKNEDSIEALLKNKQLMIRLLQLEISILNHGFE